MANRHSSTILSILCLILPIFLSLILSLLDTVREVGIFSFLGFFLLVVFDLFRLKRIALSQVWLVANVYVIVSELLLDHQYLDSHPYGYIASRNIIICALLVYAGCVFGARGKLRDFGSLSRLDFYYVPRRYGAAILCVAGIGFSLYIMPSALASLNSGRSVDFHLRSALDLLVDSVLMPIGVLVPPFISYFLRKGYVAQRWKLFSRVVMILALTLLALLGTRFYVLFSVGSACLVYFGLQVPKRSGLLLVLGPLLVVLVALSMNYLKEFRGSGLEGASLGDRQSQSTGFSAWESIGGYMSPEGVVKVNADLIDYFSKHDHLYGLSSGFLLYFWVPRFLWPDKPNMLSYWIIRKYEDGFSEGHSASVGFLGDLYADFGVGAFFAMPLIGLFMGRIQVLTEKVRFVDGPSVVMAMIAYPAVFFFVRSPITTLINLVSFFVIYHVVRRAIFNKIKNG